MDPQQRLVLELGWEALEDAGILAAALSGRQVGVFVGAMADDYALLGHERGGRRDRPPHADRPQARTHRQPRLVRPRPARPEPHGRHRPVLVAGRRAPGLREPARGESELALAGGVNLNLGAAEHRHRRPLRRPVARRPLLHLRRPRQRLRARRGRRARRPQAAGPRARRRRRRPLRDPRQRGQQRRRRRRPDRAQPDRPAGGAAQRVPAGRDRPRRGRLRRTARHRDPGGRPGRGGRARRGARRRPPARPAAARRLGQDQRRPPGGRGRHRRTAQDRPRADPRTAPAEPELRAPNPDIAFDDWKLRVVDARTAWPRHDGPQDGPLLAGVSSFGVGGTNCHVVLASAPEPAARPERPADREPPTALPWVLSGRTPGALRDQARGLLDHLAGHPDLHPADVGRALALSRTRFAHRAVVVGTGRAELTRGLDAVAAGTPAPGVATGTAAGSADHPAGAVFVFPGQGSQWVGMGRELLARSPVFRDRMAECAAALAPFTDRSLLDVLDDPERAAPGRGGPARAVGGDGVAGGRVVRPRRATRRRGGALAGRDRRRLRRRRALAGRRRARGGAAQPGHRRRTRRTRRDALRPAPAGRTPAPAAAVR